MTVERLCAEMSSAELMEWMALDAIRNAEIAKEQRLASKNMRARR